jgi:ketosteroid isomerase-like protein
MKTVNSTWPTREDLMSVETIKDAQLSGEEIIRRNLEVVEAHFHNETPDKIHEAVALYTDDIVWEGPARGLVFHSAEDALAGYHDIFSSLRILSHTQLRRFATEDAVFDDCIYECEYVEDHMENFPFPKGTKVRMRLAHIFEMRDGKIAKEIAYEIIRRVGDPNDRDDIPEGSSVTVFE